MYVQILLVWLCVTLNMHSAEMSFPWIYTQSKNNFLHNIKKILCL